jgi:hypothetical protein
MRRRLSRKRERWRVSIRCQSSRPNWISFRAAPSFGPGPSRNQRGDDYECCQKGLLAAFIFLFMAGGCKRATKQPGVTGGQVKGNGIHMTGPGKCDVDQRDMTLRLNTDEVSWSSDRHPYKVLFQPTPPGTNPSPGTPFIGSNGKPIYEFTIPASGTARSGVPVVTGYFQYSINDDHGECNTDPGLNIQS